LEKREFGKSGKSEKQENSEEGVGRRRKRAEGNRKEEGKSKKNLLRNNYFVFVYA
jgi:hypothetical protein